MSSSGVRVVVAPSKILCVGRNYRAHAAEMGSDVPSQPLLFLKPPSALLTTGEAIALPPQSSRVEFEGEIAVILGRPLRNASESEARAAVSHVVALNDVTARDLQRSDGQWTRAKGFDTFCPVGNPIPIDEVDLSALEVVTTVNGVERQRGSVHEMVFSIPFVLAYASSVMTLLPGDLMTTGTPEGVGPLSAGDVVRVEIPGVSHVENPVVGAAGS
jgi:2-keto-4-pentenoate hydratase/2-oxohepta-3-ene-1,7-dioic acid hydratase in catechol pathway